MNNFLGPLTLSLAALVCGQAAPSMASEREDAYRLGAFAGAMKYCEENHDGSSRRYRWAQLRAFQEISDMRSSARLRAMAARERAMERGHFFGEPLNDRSCQRLLRMGEWQRFRNS